MNSILTSTKRLLNIEEDDTTFDLDIVTYINAAFSTLNQLGIGQEGFFIENNTAVWEDFDVPGHWLQSVKTYVALKSKIRFDPPATSYHTLSLDREILELETRLSLMREYEVNPAEAPPDFILDGGGP